MDAVSATQTTTASTSVASSTTTSDDDADRISADFDNFLNMLTVQLENQDPLDPMDSDQFAMQLATFSSVEQAVKTNDLLRDLNSAFSSQNLSGLASWVGKEARVAAPLGYDGTPVTFYPEPVRFAASTDFVIRDSSGNEQGRIPISSDNEPYVWEGQLSAGRTAEEGPYTFSVESKDASGTVIGTSTPESYVPVREARNDNGAVSVVLAGGSSVPTSQVIAIR